MNLNPVLAKELKINVRSVKTTLIILIFNAILAVISLLVLYGMVDLAKYSGGINYSNMIELYVAMACIEYGMFILIVPAMTASSISGERERQTLDLLLTTKMQPISIIIGKLIASLSTVCILAFSTLPILSLVFIFGGLGLGDFLNLMIYFIVAAVFMGSIGIFFSTMTKKTTGATVLTYAAVIFFFGGTIALVLMIYLFLLYKNNIGGSYIQPDVGGMIYILLVNPAVSFASLLTGQVGYNSTLNDFFNSFGKYDRNFIMDHWLIMSCSIQLALSGFFIWLSSKAINPLRKNNGSRKTTKNKTEK